MFCGLKTLKSKEGHLVADGRMSVSLEEMRHKGTGQFKTAYIAWGVVLLGTLESASGRVEEESGKVLGSLACERQKTNRLAQSP